MLVPLLPFQFAMLAFISLLRTGEDSFLPPS
jgi:hypothetical protein